MAQSVYKLYKKTNVEDTLCYLNMHDFIWYFMFLIKKNNTVSVPNRYTKSTWVVRNQGPTITTKEKNLLELIFTYIACRIRHHSVTFTCIKNIHKIPILLLQGVVALIECLTLHWGNIILEVCYFFSFGHKAPIQNHMGSSAKHHWVGKKKYKYTEFTGSG